MSALPAHQESSASREWAGAWCVQLVTSARAQAWPMPFVAGRAPQDMRALLAPPMPRRWSVPRVGTACREWASAVCAQLVCMDPCPDGTSSAGGGTQCVQVGVQVVTVERGQVLPWALAGACGGLALLGVAWALRLEAQRRKDSRPESRVVPVCDNVRVVSVGTKTVYSLEESENCQ